MSNRTFRNGSRANQPPGRSPSQELASRGRGVGIVPQDMLSGYSDGRTVQIPPGYKPCESPCLAWIINQQNEERRGSYYPYPWDVPPEGSEDFDELAAVVLPAAGAAETIILQFQVPDGYDLVVKGILTEFTGPGFTQGSGNLIWRFRRGQGGITGSPVPNYGSIQFSLGNRQQNRPITAGTLASSGDYLTLTIVHVAGSPIVPPGGPSVIGGLNGYMWPRGSVPISYGGSY